MMGHPAAGFWCSRRYFNRERWFAFIAGLAAGECVIVYGIPALVRWLA